MVPLKYQSPVGSLLSRVAPRVTKSSGPKHRITQARQIQSSTHTSDGTSNPFDFLFTSPEECFAGRNVDVAFGEKIMHKPVHIKMDAHNQLVLSQAVCGQGS